MSIKSLQSDASYEWYKKLQTALSKNKSSSYDCTPEVRILKVIAAIGVPERNKLIVDTWLSYVKKKRTVVFCASVKHAEQIAKLFQDAGIAALAVSGSMKTSERNEQLAKFASGDIKVLCACDLLNEGWDCPQTEVLFMARPTMSKVLYTQQLGRGMRNCEGKDYLMVFDFVDNASQYNAPYSIHRLFKLKDYHAGGTVLGRKGVREAEADLYAKTQKETLEKLHQRIEDYRGVELTEDSKMTLGEWLDRWLNEYMIFTIRESTWDSYASMIRVHVRPYLGDKPVAFITTADVQRMYNKIKKNGRQEAHPLRGHELADSTVRSVHMMLHEAMDVAVRERLIVKNPTDGTTIPKNNYAPKQILTEAQLEKFMSVAMQDEVWRDFFYTELTTGLRLGEICGLRWSDFDEATGRLKISRTVKRKKGGGVTWGDTKTETGMRNILLPPSTAEILRERKKTAMSEWIFPNIYRPEEAMHPEYPYNRMKTLLKQAGLPLIRFHDLRHTFATHALTGGVDAKTLSRILGHTNASFTLDTYTHVTTDMQKRASGIVGGFMEDLIIKE